MFLNGQPIIADRMPQGTSADATGSKRVPLIPLAERAGKHITESAAIQLTGKKYFKIRVEFVHNTHFLVENSDHGSLRWAERVADKTILETFYCLSSGSFGRLKTYEGK